MASKKSRVREILNLFDYDEVLNLSVDNLVVIKFSATWCGPCRAIKGKYDDVSTEYTRVVFAHLDIDCAELGILKILEHVDRVPTFLFIQNYEIVSSFTGASIDKLVAFIKELHATSTKPESANSRVNVRRTEPAYTPKESEKVDKNEPARKSDNADKVEACKVDKAEPAKPVDKADDKATMDSKLDLICNDDGCCVKKSNQ